MSNAEENAELAKLRSILSTMSTYNRMAMQKAVRSHLSLSISKQAKIYLPVGVLLSQSVHVFFKCFCVRSGVI